MEWLICSLIVLFIQVAAIPVFYERINETIGYEFWWGPGFLIIAINAALGPIALFVLFSLGVGYLIKKVITKRNA